LKNKKGFSEDTGHFLNDKKKHTVSNNYK